jgi:hypothetical protein
MSDFEYDDDYGDELSDAREADDVGHYQHAGTFTEADVVARHTGAYGVEDLTKDRLAEEEYSIDPSAYEPSPDETYHNAVADAAERYETDTWTAQEEAINNAASTYNLPREALEEAIPLAYKEGIRQFIEAGGTLAEAQRAFEENPLLYHRTAVNDAAESLNDQVIGDMALRRAGLR